VRLLMQAFCFSAPQFLTSSSIGHCRSLCRRRRATLCAPGSARRILNDINGDLVTLFASHRTTSKSSCASSSGQSASAKCSSGRR
jgi:hypothetical protein